LAFAALNINEETMTSTSSVVVLICTVISVMCLFGIGIGKDFTSVIALSSIGSITFTIMWVSTFRFKRPRQRSILPSTFDIGQNNLGSKLTQLPVHKIKLLH